MSDPHQLTRRTGHRHCATRRSSAPLLAVFELVGKKFYSVQINTAVTDFSANSHRFVSVGILEFDFDVASYRQVGGSEETQPAFAEVDAAASTIVVSSE